MNASPYSQLVLELNQLGFPVAEVSDLYNNKHEYKAAIPLLVSYLDRITDASQLEEVVRALSVKWAKPTATVKLAELFATVGDANPLGLRWVVGNALAVVANDEVADDVLRYVTDQRYGRSREMLPLALVAMKDKRVDDVLIDLLDDDDVVGHALMAIKRRGVFRAYERVERLKGHPKAWVRKEAAATLLKLSDSC